jgi:hypothetical protein
MPKFKVFLPLREPLSFGILGVILNNDSDCRSTNQIDSQRSRFSVAISKLNTERTVQNTYKFGALHRI